MRWGAVGACVIVAVGCGGLDQSHRLAVGSGQGLGLGGATGEAGSAPEPDGGAGVPPVAPAPDSAGGMGGAGSTAGVGTAGIGGVAGAGGATGGTGGAGCIPTRSAGPALAPESAPKLDLCSTPPSLSTAMRLAPVDAGQHYVRCGTRGPEAGWNVTVSPGGRYLAARTSAGTVRLIDVEAWREIVQLASPVGHLDAVAFSPDGQHLATLSAEAGEVTLWRTSDGSLERSWASLPASKIDSTASSLAFSSDGRLLATSLGPNENLSTNGISLQILDTTAPAQLQTPAIDPESFGSGAAFPFMRFVANDSMLLVQASYQIGDSDRSSRLSLLAPSCRTEITLFNGYSYGLQGYAASPDGQRVAFAALGNGDSGLFVVQAATGAVTASDPTFRGQVLAFSPDGAVIYVQQDDVVTALDPRTLQPQSSFPLSSGSSFLAVAPGGDLIATNAGATWWWAPATGQVTRTLPFALRNIAWSKDGSVEVVTGDDRLFHAYRTADTAELCAPAGGGAAITNMAMSPGGAEVAYAYADGTIEVSGTSATSELPQLAASLKPVTGLAVSEDGRRVAVLGGGTAGSSTSNLTLTLFDATAATTLQRLILPPYDASAGTFSPDGALFATIVYDQTTHSPGARVWNVASGAVVLDLPPSGTQTYDQPDQFNHDGTELSVATEHGLEVWHLADGTRAKTFPAGTMGLSPIWWTYAAAGSATGGFAVARASDGGPVGTFEPLDTFSVTFAGGDKLVAGDNETWMHGGDYAAEYVWDVQSGARLRILPTAAFAIPADGEQILTLDGAGVAVWCR